MRKVKTLTQQFNFQNIGSVIYYSAWFQLRTPAVSSASQKLPFAETPLFYNFTFQLDSAGAMTLDWKLASGTFFSSFLKKERGITVSLNTML